MLTPPQHSLNDKIRTSDPGKNGPLYGACIGVALLLFASYLGRTDATDAPVHTGTMTRAAAVSP
jgi:hypothetical protein